MHPMLSVVPLLLVESYVLPRAMSPPGAEKEEGPAARLVPEHGDDQAKAESVQGRERAQSPVALQFFCCSTQRS